MYCFHLRLQNYYNFLKQPYNSNKILFTFNSSFTISPPKIVGVPRRGGEGV